VTIVIEIEGVDTVVEVVAVTCAGADAICIKVDLIGIGNAITIVVNGAVALLGGIGVNVVVGVVAVLTAVPAVTIDIGLVLVCDQIAVIVDLVAQLLIPRKSRCIIVVTVGTEVGAISILICDAIVDEVVAVIVNLIAGLGRTGMNGGVIIVAVATVAVAAFIAVPIDIGRRGREGHRCFGRCALSHAELRCNHHSPYFAAISQFCADSVPDDATL